MYSAHILTQPAHTLRPGSAHNARWALCRGAQGAVSQAMPCRVVAVSLRWRPVSQRALAVLSPPPVTIQKLYRDPNLCRSPCRARCRACRRALVPCCRALLRRIAACIASHIKTQRPPPATINFCIATPLLARSPAHATARPCARPAAP